MPYGLDGNGKLNAERILLKKLPKIYRQATLRYFVVALMSVTLMFNITTQLMMSYVQYSTLMLFKVIRW